VSETEKVSGVKEGSASEMNLETKTARRVAEALKQSFDIGRIGFLGFEVVRVEDITAVIASALAATGGDDTRMAMGANPAPAWSKDKLTLEQADELYRFLQGKPIEGIHTAAMPNLTSEQAFSVLYVLQEHLQLIPDHYERCDKCGDLLDDYREGHYDEKTGQHYCEGCL
jgi:hypothetical protein